MIDEQAVLTAKILKRLYSLRVTTRLRESEFEQFALMAIAFFVAARAVPERFDEILLELKKVASLRSVDSFHLAWRRACDALVERIDGGFGRDFPAYFGSPEAFEGICSLLETVERDQYLVGRPTDDSLHDCFDEMFHRVVGRLTSFGYRRGDPAVVLGAFLSADFDSSADYFATTGELAVLRHRVLDVRPHARLAVIDGMSFFVGLRLALYGIYATQESIEHGEFPSVTHNQFMFIDHPRRKASGKSLFASTLAKDPTSLKTLQLLLDHTPLPDRTLIVVPGADRTASGWRLHFRETLARSGRLLAVIDLPNVGRDKSRTQLSAWLVANTPRLEDDVLMVDAKALASRSDLSDIRSLMKFVTTIVSIALGGDGPSLARVKKTSYVSDNVEAIFDAYFQGGYRDVTGVCRRVKMDVITNECDSKLVASIYLEPGEKHSKFAPLLNNEPVLNALRTAGDRGVRLYVIGNNGEGKSMLLRDLADLLIKDGRSVVGISFGLTDRFSFTRTTDGDQPFKYVGARTSEKSIALGRTSADVTSLVGEIHVDPVRLAVFSEIVRGLGFAERRYLVPESPRLP